MRTRIGRTAVVCLFAVLAPLGVQALSDAELQSRIAALLAQVAALQLRLQSLQSGSAGSGNQSTAPLSQGANSVPAGTSGNRAVCPGLKTTLSFGSEGDEVLQLQVYLQSEGYYERTFRRGFFDAATEAAVQQWQYEHGLVLSGTPATTGYGVVGPRTRFLIALNCREAQKEIARTLTPSGGTRNTSGQIVCSAASPPLTACSTGWQAVTDSYGCTKSYKCVTSLVTTATNVGPISVSCPIYQRPFCTNGATVEWRGNDTNGCSLGYYCVPPPPISCPAHPVPACTANEDIEEGVIGSNGCRTAARCVARNSACSAQVAASEAYAIGKICTQELYTLRCPTNASYAVNTGGCAGGYLRSLGWAMVDIGTNGNLSASPSSGDAPLLVQFSGSVRSSGYSVVFGDGTQSGDINCVDGGCTGVGPTDVNVTHTYNSAGTYIAKLRAHGMNSAAQCAGVDCNVVGTATVTVAGGGTNGGVSITNLSVSGTPYSVGGTIPVTWTTSGITGDVGMFVQLVGQTGIMKSVRVAPTANSVSIDTSTFCNGGFSDAIDADCQMIRSAVASGKNIFYITAGLFTPSQACFGYCAPGSASPNVFFSVATPSFLIQ
jgi:peptidoglycan hydrolase-like protein with peptidoglycan-binding domain